MVDQERMRPLDVFLSTSCSKKSACLSFLNVVAYILLKTCFLDVKTDPSRSVTTLQIFAKKSTNLSASCRRQVHEHTQNLVDNLVFSRF